MTHAQDRSFLATEPVGKLLLKLAVPTVAAQLINMLYNVVDRIYIGHMPGDGALALTGIGVCMPLIMLVSAFAALVASGGAPMMASYYATKNYVLRLTQAVAEELRRDGSAVRVCALAPGPVDTEFNAVAGVRFALPGLSSKECAKCAIDGVLKGKTVIIPGWQMKISVMASKLTPEWLLPRITYSIQKKKVDKD